MFEVGFWELILLAVLCLLVVGPRRLPGMMRSFGHWSGRAKLAVRRMKAEFDRALDTDDDGRG